MSRVTLVYIVVLLASAAGVWAILRAGERLQAPTDLAGRWYVGGEDPAVPEQLGETVDIEQSGRYFRLSFAHGLRVDVRLAEPPAKPGAGENLDMVFEGPQWKLNAFGSGADGPLIFRLVGPERHTFTVSRNSPGEDDAPAGTDEAGRPEAASASAAALLPPADAGDDGEGTSEAETAAAAAVSTDAP